MTKTGLTASSEFGMLIAVGNVEAGMFRWQAALKLIGVGWFVGISILLGVLGGLWLDNKFNTEPILVIVGLILGVVVAFYGVYRMLQPLISTKDDKGE